MRVLMLHNRYLQRGGEDESTDAEVALLRSHGHEVHLFEMDNRQVATQSLLRTSVQTVWSQAAYHLVQQRLREKRFDIVHVQNFFPLFSPAVHYAVKTHPVATVQALRNYRLFCLNGLFYRKGEICEECLGKFFPYPGVAHACYRHSHAASMVVALMLGTHRILRTWQEHVDIFYTPTDYARRKFIEAGLPAQKIIAKPNFVSSAPVETPGYGQSFALFVGRLVAEKGVKTLLQAWNKLSFPVPIRIAGDGPLEPLVREQAALQPHIHCLGRVPAQYVLQLSAAASFVIFPSQWYETFGRAIIEAYAFGRPVIASDLGTMAELVIHGKTGLRFKAGDADDLAAKVAWAWAHPAEMAEMGRNARREYELKYTPERNYEMLMEIYQRAIENHRHRAQGKRA